MRRVTFLEHALTIETVTTVEKTIHTSIYRFRNIRHVKFDNTTSTITFTHREHPDDYAYVIDLKNMEKSQYDTLVKCVASVKQ